MKPANNLPQINYIVFILFRWLNFSKIFVSGLMWQSLVVRRANRWCSSRLQLPHESSETFAHSLTEISRTLLRAPSSARDWTIATPFSMEFHIPTSIAFSVCRKHLLVSCAQRHTDHLWVIYGQSIHWLPIRQYITYNIASTVRLRRQPAYLADLIVDYSPSRSLYSQGKDLLVVLMCTTQIASRASRVAAPSIWNSLPIDNRSTATRIRFCRQLGPYFFNIAYN